MQRKCVVCNTLAEREGFSHLASLEISKTGHLPHFLTTTSCHSDPCEVATE
jgi:hypothetical protein